MSDTSSSSATTSSSSAQLGGTTPPPSSSSSSSQGGGPFLESKCFRAVYKGAHVSTLYNQPRIGNDWRNHWVEVPCCPLASIVTGSSSSSSSVSVSSTPPTTPPPSSSSSSTGGPGGGTLFADCCSSNANLWIYGEGLTVAIASQAAILDYTISYLPAGYVRTGNWSKVATPSATTSSTSSNMWYLNVVDVNQKFGWGAGLVEVGTYPCAGMDDNTFAYGVLNLVHRWQRPVVYSKFPIFPSATLMSRCENHGAGVGIGYNGAPPAFCYDIRPRPLNELRWWNLNPRWANHEISGFLSLSTFDTPNRIWYGNPLSYRNAQGRYFHGCGDFVAAGRSFYSASECSECFSDGFHLSNPSANPLELNSCGYPLSPCPYPAERVTPAGIGLLMECCKMETITGSQCPSKPSIPAFPGYYRGNSSGSCSLASNVATISPLAVSGNNCAPIQQTFTITDNDGLKAISYNGLAVGATISGTHALGDKVATFDYSWASPRLGMSPTIIFGVQDVCDNVTFLRVSVNIADARPCPSSSSQSSSSDHLLGDSQPSWGFEVQDCATGVQWIADDTMGGLSPVIGDFIIVQDISTMTTFCVEVIGQTSSGTATHSTTVGGFLDCADCNTYLPGGPISGN